MGKKLKILTAFLILFLLFILFFAVYVEQRKDEVVTIECNGKCQFFEDNVCKEYACCEDADCDDGDARTQDVCWDNGTKFAQCGSIFVGSNDAEIFLKSDMNLTDYKTVEIHFTMENITFVMLGDSEEELMYVDSEAGTRLQWSVMDSEGMVLPTDGLYCDFVCSSIENGRLVKMECAPPLHACLMVNDDSLLRWTWNMNEYVEFMENCGGKNYGVHRLKRVSPGDYTVRFCYYTGLDEPHFGVLCSSLEGAIKHCVYRRFVIGGET